MDFRKDKYIKKLWVAIGIVIFANILFYVFFYRAPGAFPIRKVVSVSNGMSLSEIAEKLEAEQVVRSPFWFTNFVLLLRGEKQIVGGDYYFEQSLSVFEVARRITKGIFNIDQIRTTIPEGSNIFEIAKILKGNYPTFDEARFLQLAEEREGYLFPDTYHFGANPDPEKVIEVMVTTFNKKTNDPEIKDAIRASGKNLDEIITMASIVENEARQTRTRRIIAGILWERIRLSMPLQVDVSFKYINGKTTKDITLNDLKIDSPYNSYLYKGLPPTPISNPGLDSIMATVNPIPTDYLFFLSDASGTMHYARTFEEHQYNKARYLE